MYAGAKVQENTIEVGLRRPKTFVSFVRWLLQNVTWKVGNESENENESEDGWNFGYCNMYSTKNDLAGLDLAG